VRQSRKLNNVGQHEMGGQKFVITNLSIIGILEAVGATFVVISTYESALGPRGGLWLVLLMCNP
jgi:hypothetical protein